MNKIKEILNKWSQEGIRFPFAYDNEGGKGSATLLFYYVFSVFLIISLILLHFNIEYTMATCVTTMVWIISYICYRVRKIDKFKLDLDDKSLEVEADDKD